MPDPAALPAELFNAILGWLVRDEPTVPYLQKPPQRRSSREANLHNASQLSHAWHMTCTPKLYSEFQWVGDRHSFSRLRHFLRTVIRQPSLGGLVLHLDLRECQSWYDSRLQSEDASDRGQLQREGEAWALFDVGHRFGYTQDQLVHALRTESRLPCIAILLACLSNVLSNVSTLFLSATKSVYEAFQLVFQEPCMLRHLQKATLFGSPINQSVLRSYPPLHMMNVQEVFFLPSIRTLELFGVELHAMSGILGQKGHRQSPVTHLTIVPGGDPRCISAGEKQILQTCLELPKVLVSLTLYLPSYTSMGDSNAWSYMIPNDQLWQMLSSHQQTLEHLDIYDQDACHKQTRIQQTSHFGLLSDFKRLRILRIQPQVLLGGFDGSTRAPYRLRRTMPASVSALTLYGSQSLSAELESQLEEVVSDPLYLRLRLVVLEDTSRNRRHQADPIKHHTKTSLKEFCNGRNVLLKLIPSDHLPRGGQNPLEREEAYSHEEDLLKLSRALGIGYGI